MSAFWTTRRVLVTGGTGFLGRAVVHQLEQAGAKEVVAAGSADADLRLADEAARLLRETDPDLVIHLAARVGGIGANMERPASLYLENLLMGTYLIEAAHDHGVEKTVLIGTICSYPKFTQVPFREESLWTGYPEETNAPYGIAKLAHLVHARANHQQYGQQLVYLMPTNLYGPGDKFNAAVSHVIPALVKKLVEAKEQGADHVEVWGTGSASREFLYVDDAARGIVLAAEHHHDPEPINLGADREISIKELVELLAELVGYRGDVRWDASKPDGQPRRGVDPSKAAEAFGFRAETPFDEGLRRTIDWYLAHRVEAEAKTL